MDFIISLFALIVLSPMLLIVVIIVRIKLGAPVFFMQKRPGLNEKLFTLYKFRTMTDKRDDKGELLPDEIRLTNFGRMLRSTSLDELPELFNILKGDMSIVGPRPLLEQYLPLYTDKERHRHDIRPGLTGLAQISGRNYINWDAKFEKDLEYLNSISFRNDFSIILTTVKKVLQRENIETASVIVNDGVKYVPLDVERSNERKEMQ
jgi:lipopolysaccharide/colanic/teichoic acid biosynthesis glycosyltransferase